MKKENIKVNNHFGTWYVISEATYNCKDYYLLEHEEYGDEASSVIIDNEYNIVLEDVCNGFDDLEEYLGYN